MAIGIGVGIQFLHVLGGSSDPKGTAAGVATVTAVGEAIKVASGAAAGAAAVLAGVVYEGAGASAGVGAASAEPIVSGSAAGVATVTGVDGGDTTLPLLQSAKVWIETDVGGGPTDNYWESGDFTITANADPTPDQFDSITNQGTLGGTFANTGTLRPSVAHLVGDGEARRVALLDGVNDTLVSSRAASNYQYLHTGDFDECITAVLKESATGDIVATCDNLSETGIRVTQDGSDKIQVDLCNGTGTAYLSAVTAAALTIGNVYRVRYQRSGTTLTVTAYDVAGSAETTGSDNTTSGSAPTGDPAKTHTIGGASKINVSACVSFNSALSAGDWTLVEDYTATRYTDTDYDARIKAAVDGFVYSLADSSMYETATGISRLYDLSGNARDAYQATGANQPAYSATGFNSAYPAAVFDGSDDYMLISAGLGWSASVGHHFFASCTPATNLREALFDASAGRLQLFAADPNNDTSVYDGSYRATSAAPAGGTVQLAEFEADGTNTTATCRRGGADLASGAMTATALGGTVALGARNDGALNNFTGPIAEVTYANAVITGAALDEVRRKMAISSGLASATGDWTLGIGLDHDPSDDTQITTAGGTVTAVGAGEGSYASTTVGGTPQHSQSDDWIDYDGSERVEHDGAEAVTNTREFTIYVRCKLDDTTSLQGIIGAATAATTTQLNFLRTYTSKFQWVSAAGAGTVVDLGATDTDEHLWVIRVRQESATVHKLDVWKDDVQVVTDASLYNNVGSTSDSFGIAGIPYNSTVYDELDGKVGRARVYYGAHSDATRAQVTAEIGIPT